MSGAGDALSELQAESQRQRLQFLQAELDLSFTFLSMAEVEHATGNTEIAEQSLADAEKGYGTVVRYLSDPKHGLGGDQRQAVQTQLRELRDKLDHAKHHSQE